MTPKVSVLLASFGEQSQRYLNLCFRSLEAQTMQDFEVIHVSSGPFSPNPTGNRTRRHIHSPDRLHFPEAIDMAYKYSAPSSECILLLNDDVIMQKNCLRLLYETTMAAQTCILNPKSNCDDNGRFYASEGRFFKLQYRIEEMEELYKDVIDFNNDRQPFLIVKQPQVHFYCTMMTRKCWNDVGGIDVNLKTGFDDADFCLRARAKGYFPVIAMHAYALHGSGVSADLHITQEDRAFNEKYFNEKHAFGVER